jgi:hypothetical protein
VLVLAILVPAASVVATRSGASTERCLLAALSSTLLAAWAMRLVNTLVPLWGAAALAELLGLSPLIQISPTLTLRGLGGAVFVYLVLWVFATYEREPGLQPVATAALIMAAGVLCQPALALACLLLSITFFLLNWRRRLGRSMHFALLLFTPTFLFFTAAVGLAMLTNGRLMASPLASFSREQWTVWHMAGWSGLVHFASTGPLLFPAAILAMRVAGRRCGSTDLAYCLLIAMVAGLALVGWIRNPYTVSEVCLMTTAGAAALLTTGRPLGAGSLTLVVAGAGADLVRAWM